MTMIPAQNISKRHAHGGYGGGKYSESFSPMSRLEGTYESECCSEGCLGSDLVVVGPMAEDESRTESTVNEGGSSSKDVQDDRDEGWLQLGIGGQTTTSHDQKKLDDQVDRGTIRASAAGLVELDLLPGGSSQQLRSPPSILHHAPEFRTPRPVSNFTSATGYSTSFLFQHPGTSSTFPHPQNMNWVFRPLPQNITVPPVAAAAVGASSSSSSSSSLMPTGSYFTRPFQLRAGVDVAGPSSGFRVVHPPRRPHSGIWFMLRASQNQSKEPFLPQIPKSYLRIKDGTMTVRLLMKYLANKLRLDSESEIEITCRGQQLQPCLTLQQVRDQIWSPRDALTLLPDSSTTDHLMLLHYASR